MQMEVGMPLNWSIDLIEVDVQADVVYSNVQLDGVVLKAKQDTGAQFDIMSMTVFQDIQKIRSYLHIPSLASSSLAMETKL